MRNNLVTTFKNKPLIVKISFILIVIIIAFYIVNAGYYYFNNISNEKKVREFSFIVNSVNFESMFDRRGYNDTFLIIKTETVLTKEQFSNKSFVIPGEEVKAELLSEKEIKVYLLSPLKKNIKSKIEVSYYGKKIYKYDFLNSIFDEEDVKNNPITEIDIN